MSKVVRIIFDYLSTKKFSIGIMYYLSFFKNIKPKEILVLMRGET